MPIAIEEVDLPFRFEGIQTEQLINWDGSDSFPSFRKLVADIASIVGEPPNKLQVPKLNGQQSEGEAVAKIIQNSIRMAFVLIPAGKFMMGGKLNADEVAKKYGADASWYRSEHPRHKVTLNEPFYLQTTEATQRQWRQVMGNNPSNFKDCGDDCPVENVSWNDAQEFIRTLNEMEGTDNYRLPTEAEWEYACRAGSTTEFSFGDDAAKLGEYGWYSDNSGVRTHPVATKKPNAWRLYDMHGNVWEWVEDDYHGSYQGAPDDGRAWTDDSRLRGSDRVIRGGGWDNGAHRCRSANRYDLSPEVRSGVVGLRLARSV